MKVPVLDHKGKKIEEINLNSSIFGLNPKEAVLSQYVYSYLSNQREGNADTKGRGDVSGGGRKPWRQKGTGRARVGSNRSPIWRGGGVTHGPTNLKNWKKKMTKKFKKVALKYALSKKALEGNVRVLSKVKFNLEKPLTKQGINLIKVLGSPKKALFISENKDTDLLKVFSNIENVKVTFVGEINAYNILNGGEIIFLKDSLNLIEKIWGDKEEVSIKSSKKGKK